MVVPWLCDEYGNPLDEVQRELAMFDEKHLIINAGPGSGKTRVLVAHYLHLMLTHDHWDIDAVVAITFTEKAAAEMKERIARVLQRVREVAPEEQWRKRARELLFLLPEAPIGTIHSFCARLLRRFALQAGLDPSFGILDELETQPLRRRVCEHWLWSQWNNPDAPLNKEVAKIVAHWGAEDAIAILSQLLEHRLLIESRKAKGSPLLCCCAGELTEAEEALERCYEALASAYEEEKRRRNVLDFDDLLLKTWDLLRKNPDVLEQVRAVHHRFLVDELQDTDRVQMDILRLICGWDDSGAEKPKVLFFGVGDSQQSIYGFRNADVSVFNELWQKAQKRYFWQYASLNRNYRSVASLVHFFNHTFKRVFQVSERADSPEQLFRAPLQKMKPVREDSDGCSVEIAFFMLPSGANRLPNKWQRLRWEAEWVAQRIEKLHQEGAAYRDIAVLLRQLTDASFFEDALRRYRIPYYIITGYGFFETAEARDLFAFLETLAEPDNELALATWLRSPMIGVSDETLFHLFSDRGGQDGRSRLASADSLPLPEQERLKLQRAKRLLDEGAKIAEQSGVRALLEWLLRETQYELIAAALPHGRQRLANIRKFLRTAQTLSTDLRLPLQGVVRYAKGLMTEETRIGEPPLAGAATDAVQVMTIHAAKGLEFPIVFVPLLSEVQSPQRSREKVVAAPECGLGVRTKSLTGEGERNDRFDAVDSWRQQREEAELERLLFVACTRAKDRLILVGCMEAGGGRSTPRNRRWTDWAQLLWNTLQLHPLAEGSAEQTLTISDKVTVRLHWVSESDGQKPFRRGEETLGTHWLQEPSSIPSVSAPSLPLPSASPAVVRISVTELLEEQERLLATAERLRPETALSPLQVGSLVHALLRRQLLEPTEEDIRASALWLGIDPDAAVADAERLRQFLRRAAQSTAWQTLQKAPQRWHELDFRLYLDGKTAVELIGRWDAVAAGAPWLVVDFKTDAVASPDEAEKLFSERYLVQAQAYALGAHRAFGAETVRVAFVFVGIDPACEVTKDFGLDDWQHLAENLRARALELLKKANGGDEPCH